MMEKLTGENVGRKMAIVLDEKITARRHRVQDRRARRIPWADTRSLQAAAR